MTLTFLPAAATVLLAALAMSDARNKADDARFSAAERVLCQGDVCDIQPRVAE